MIAHAKHRQLSGKTRILNALSISNVATIKQFLLSSEQGIASFFREHSCNFKTMFLGIAVENMENYFIFLYFKIGREEIRISLCSDAVMLLNPIFSTVSSLWKLASNKQNSF